MNKNVKYCPLCGGTNVEVNRLSSNEDIWHYESDDSDGERLDHPTEVSCDDCNESFLIVDFE